MPTSGGSTSGGATSGGSASGGPSSGRPRGGARRASRGRPRISVRVVVLAGAALVALLGWAALVWTAIGFGRSARGGEHGDWWWLALCAAGAVVCLVACLLLGATALTATTRPAKTAAQRP